MLENNKLIAEFLGWENLDKTCLNVGEDTFIIDSNLVYDRSYLNLELEDGSSVCTMCAEFLKFNSDWNWLMLAIDKIESLPQCEVVIDKDLVEIYYKTYRKSLKGVSTSKIEATYEACVEFIKWYNENGG